MRDDVYGSASFRFGNDAENIREQFLARSSLGVNESSVSDAHVSYLRLFGTIGR